MILTNGFDPDVRVYKEARFLVDKGFHITILCWDRECEYKQKSEEILDGINIKRFHIFSKPGSGIKQIPAFMKFIKETRKYIKYNNEFEYIHCHDLDGAIVGYISTIFKKDKKRIFDMHEIYTSKEFIYGKFKLITDIILNRIYKKFDKIIYVNEIQTENVNKKYKEKLVFLPNYPILTDYKPIEKEKNANVRINYVGSVRDYKSLKSLIDAGNTMDEVNIGIYGTGTCYEEIKNINLPKNVNVYGKYDGIKDISKIYRNTEILYCSYDNTNYNWKIAYPVKLFESIITLTPIIVSKDTVAGEFVLEKKIGRVIEYGNSESVIEAIRDIIENYEKYIGRLKEIANSYKWEEVVENLYNIYKEEV